MLGHYSSSAYWEQKCASEKKPEVEEMLKPFTYTNVAKLINTQLL